MATHAELDRKIRDTNDLISEAESASREFRDQARRAGSDSERRRLEAEAESKDRLVSKLYNEVAGYRRHKNGLPNA